MNSHIDDAQSLLDEATKTWSELEEPPEKLELQQSIQNIEKATTAMKEEDDGDELLAIGSAVVKSKRDTIQ